MTEALQVIALISGGKDSFFSLLHCLLNNHQIIALANLYPPPPPPPHHDTPEQEDLNSFMYQTVGHTVIPLYAHALQLPLYRQEIHGSAMHRDATYEREVGDETESLMPLLSRVMRAHPRANALSAGAILSTYQRTRVESVAARLGLVSLAYLWKWPVLSGCGRGGLLGDMREVGLEARIVKVASAGLDESFLWECVVEPATWGRVERRMRRFAEVGYGSLLGEGGQYETLVVDGPRELFRGGRIEVPRGGRSVVREQGGAAWLLIRDARVVGRRGDGGEKKTGPRVPDLLDGKFTEVLESLVLEELQPELGNFNITQSALDPQISISILDRSLSTTHGISRMTAVCRSGLLDQSMETETTDLISQIQQALDANSLQVTDIISTTIILRSMDDFTTVNKIYSTLITHPNPPSRVTISVGALLPHGTNVMMHVNILAPNAAQHPRKALHVQSRSYWAPANIGPYSQAISVPLPPHNSETHDCQEPIWAVAVAGQIPLIPQSMTLPPPDHELVASRAHLGAFNLQTVLALQHLWRIGVEMKVQWWTSVVAYLPRGTDVGEVRKRAVIAGRAWRLVHAPKTETEEEEEDRDIWDEIRNAPGREYGARNETVHELPDWKMVTVKDIERPVPAFSAVEVEELPRGSEVEWHSHWGIVGGAVRLFNRYNASRWAVHQCVFGTAVETTIVIYGRDRALSSGPSLTKMLEDAIRAVSDSRQIPRSHTSYLDLSLEVEGDLYMAGGVVLCRSIWNEDGRQLDAVLLFDTLPALQDDV